MEKKVFDFFVGALEKCVRKALEEIKADFKSKENVSKPQLLTVVEVCKLLHIAKPTLYKLVRAGELIPVRFAGKVVRFDIQDIQALIDENKKGGVI